MLWVEVKKKRLESDRVRYAHSSWRNFIGRQDFFVDFPFRKRFGVSVLLPVLVLVQRQNNIQKR